MSYTYKYPHPALTADIVLLDYQLHKVLLIQRKHDPFAGSWAFPGGFFDMSDPDIMHTALRELEEETHLTGITLTEEFSASKEGRDPRGRTVSIVFSANVDSTSLLAQGDDDASAAQWFNLDNLPPLAFDHKEILTKLLSNKGIPK